MPDEALAVVLVLAAALLHAVTNALIKVSGDPLITRGFMSAVAAAAMLPLLAFVDPPAPGAWPILIASVPVHTAYSFLIAAAYRRGDLSAVYPVARGISPLGVVAFALLFGVGRPGWGQLAGVAVVCMGILLIATGTGVRRNQAGAGAMAYACATGIVVATYTYLDAVGMRAAGTLASYIVWLVVLDGSVTALAIGITRRRTIKAFVLEHWKRSTAAALFGLVNFVLAMVAFGLGSIVEIAALRETSVIFAAFIGARYLGESYARRRMLAAALVVAGVAAMQLLR